MVSRDVVAPKTVEIVDVEKTAQLRSEALNNIPLIYRVDEALVEEQLQAASQFFSSVEEVRQSGSPVEETVKEELTKSWNVTPGVFDWLVNSPGEDYERVKAVFFDFLARYFSQPISEDEVEENLLQITAELERMNLEGEAVRVLTFLFSQFLRPTAVVDAEKMQAAEEEALREVKPVRRVIQEGEILLRRGDVVTAEDTETLRALGLIGESSMVLRLVLLGLVVFLAMVAEFYYLKKFSPRVLESNSFLTIRLFIVVGLLSLSILVSRFSPFFLFLPAVSLIIYSLLGRETAFGEILILFPLIIFGERADFMRSFYLYVNMFLPLFFLGKTVKRRDLVWTGLWISLINVVLVAVFSLQRGEGGITFFSNSLYGFSSGIGSSVIALGGISFLESTFGLASDLRLVELLNPTHPLLKRLLIEAPGTYNHSLMVANLAESAAEAIGANPFLARVGAYYHDVGKLKRPYFFIENQFGGKNIHNRLSPNLSALVIQTHVKDGVEIGRQYGLPVEIVEIIRRHHGTTLLRFFYEKATRGRKDQVREEEFRYSGPLPETPEEVLVFMADSVEAAVRSMSSPTPSRVEAMVNNIVQSYLRDGQLDRSSLTMRDLRKITHTFVTVLNGTFHARVAYPALEKSKEKLPKKELKESYD
ncbi:MAG: cyclic-di-AMP phosphodiesterase PgpH [Candidatus Atribacteria bacterium]|nr:cyclic-di-AMP phosphodiesterase PgpH [Candidatus Atribacteria bacterium]